MLEVIQKLMAEKDSVIRGHSQTLANIRSTAANLNAYENRAAEEARKIEHLERAIRLLNKDLLKDDNGDAVLDQHIKDRLEGD